MTVGIRYVALVPVFDPRTQRWVGWKISKTLHDTETGARADVNVRVDQRNLRTDSPRRTRVLKVEIAELEEIPVTEAKQYERAERMLFHFTEEEARLRPAAGGHPVAPPSPTVNVAHVMALALAGPEMLAEAQHGRTQRCRRCRRPCTMPRGQQAAFCHMCANEAVDILARTLANQAPPAALRDLESLSDASTAVVTGLGNLADRLDAEANRLGDRSYSYRIMVQPVVRELRDLVERIMGVDVKARSPKMISPTVPVEVTPRDLERNNREHAAEIRRIAASLENVTATADTGSPVQDHVDELRALADRWTRQTTG